MIISKVINMIRESQIRHLKEQQRDGLHILPAYRASSIAEIPVSIQKLLGVPTERDPLEFHAELEEMYSRYRNIVLLVVDGFGLDYFLEYQQNQRDFSTLHTLASSGDVRALTSVFPSTTSAAMTTLHSGLTPQEHGLMECNLYLRELGNTIQTLILKEWYSDRDLSNEKDIDKMLFDAPTLYELLVAYDIDSNVFIPEDYLQSVYNKTINKGSHMVGYKNRDRGFEHLASILNTSSRKSSRTFTHFYEPFVDKTAHQHRAGSKEHQEVVQRVFTSLQENLFKHLDAQTAKDTLFLVTADHGRIDINPHDVINLRDFPIVTNNYKQNPEGRPIVATGSPQEVFLHIKKGMIKSVERFLKGELQGRAKVMRSHLALKKGLFGAYGISQKAKDRLGQLVVIPYPGEHIWHYRSPEDFKWQSEHGGLSAQEMMVPFVAVSLDEMTVLQNWKK